MTTRLPQIITAERMARSDPCPVAERATAVWLHSRYIIR